MTLPSSLQLHSFQALLPWLPLLAVALPLLAGVTLLARPMPDSGRSHAFITVATLANSLLVFVAVALAPEDLLILWRITDSLSLAFRMDTLARLVSALVAFIWPLATLYAFEYLRRRPPEDRFFAFFLFTFGILIGMAAAANLMTLYLFFELLTFMTLPLVMHSQQREAIRGTVKYLFYSLTGAAMALGGFFFFHVYGLTMEFTPGGVLDMARVKGHEGLLLGAAFVTLVGFGAKAGLVPLHAWLPTAHPVAPTPASAVLSGLITKAGIVAMLRVVYFVVGPDFLRGTWVQAALIGLALVTIFTGSMLAYKEKHLKKRIAYSSVSQVSYVVLALMLLTPSGFVGALLQVLAHALAKSCLFLSAGVVIYFTLPGSNYHYADQLRGVGKELPVTMTCFTIASLSLIGIPVTGGFVAKWYIASGALAPSLGWLGAAGVGVLMVSAVLTAGYLMPIVIDAFFPGDDFDASNVVRFHMPMNMRLPLLLLSSGAVLTGLFSGPLVQIFEKLAAALLGGAP